MKPLDILIISVVAVLFVAAVVYAVRHKGGCGGDCAGCSRKCERRNDEKKK